VKLYKQQFVCMACPSEVGVYATDASAAKSAIKEALQEIQRLDQKYSHFKKNSYISQLQTLARQPQGTKADTETTALLNYAATQFELSDGLFDITAGALTRLWQHCEALPCQPDIDSALNTCGWRKLGWQAPDLFLPAGMQLELGGLVKEYAADRAGLILKRRGFQAAFVELGGDIHVTGPQADGSPWTMGVRKPVSAMQASNAAMATIPLSKGGLATSGDYERFRLINGKHYSHIISPISGWPVESFHSVTVLAPSCLVAGSVSTLAMLMGLDNGLVLLRESGFGWLAQGPDNEILSSDL